LEGEWDRRNLSRESEVLVRAESLEISHHARIRDKIAASKQKGMWMGGLVPLGYDVIDRRLEVINRRRRRSWKSSAVTWNSGPSGS